MRSNNPNDEESEDESKVITSFGTLSTEGFIFLNRSQYAEAISSFTRALDINSDKNILVARAKCYLQLGDHIKALEDANASLSKDKLYFKGILQKAEALFAKGDFELSLMWFHRGARLRAEVDDFRLGVNKCETAIMAVLGDPKNHKIKAPHGARLAVSLTSVKMSSVASTPMMWITASEKKSKKKDAKPFQKSAKKLLGELFEDRKFLQGFANDNDALIKNNAAKAIKFLDAKAEFASFSVVKSAKIKNRFAPVSFQQAPIEETRKTISYPKRATMPDTDRKLVIEVALNYINTLLSQKDYIQALKKSKALLTKLSETPNSKNTPRLTAEIYHIIAVIYIRLDRNTDAISSFKQEYDVSVRNDFKDYVFRAQSQLSQLYILLNKVDRAINSIEIALRYCSDITTGTARLRRDLSQIHLNSKNYDKAIVNSEIGKAEAQSLFHLRLSADCGLILGIATIHTGEYIRGRSLVNEALENSIELEDKSLEMSIRRSLMISMKQEKSRSRIAHHASLAAE